ncbi:MAG: bifunctional riboflavin kinase/FAD synthetase [Burkholderiales bacterium]
MRVFRGIPARADGPIALTIGNFDGFHLGHRAMMARLSKVARGRGLPAAVMIFEPQPQEFFAPDQAPPRLTSLREKLEFLRDCAVDRVYVCRFDYRFAQREADEFISRILRDALHTCWLLVGDDYRFGARRAGSFDLLQQAAPRMGFDVESMASVVVDGMRVSSTAIRSALAKGELAVADRLLGRCYAISGRVVHGEKLGTKLGYPTANVNLKRLRSALSGIFVVEVGGLGELPLGGVASLGVRPTITDHGKSTLEVHLFDYDRDVYGKRIDVRFLAKLRDEQKFASIDALVRQMEGDALAARQYLYRA